MALALIAALGAVPALVAAAGYSVTVRDHRPTPVLSGSNARGQGRAPDGCIVFNPSFIGPSAGFNRSGVFVRMCCGTTCTGHGAARIGASADAAERIGFAPCDLESGVCGDVLPDFNLDPTVDAEDPRAFFYPETGLYYNFYYRNVNEAAGGRPCSGPQCTVRLAASATPLDAGSWRAVATLPWHRNGCCAMRPKGQRSYCIWGEGPSPFPGLGISYTVDIDGGVFQQAAWKVAPGVKSPITADGQYLLPLGDAEAEIKLEAGTHWMQLSSGDWIHFYAAATPGWVAHGNYTAGYIILSKDDPTLIIQRSEQHVLIPTFEYETLCGGAAGCPYRGERNNVIFLCSATPMAKVDNFRLFFGGGDGNVGTAVVEVTPPSPEALVV